MKFASFVVSALFAATAFAGTSVHHDYDGALRGITLDNACITSTEVKTIAPQRVCAKLDQVTVDLGDGSIVNDWVCSKWEVTQLSYPRAFERTVCAKYVDVGDNMMVCDSYTTQADFLPAAIKVSVVTDYNEGSDFPGVTHTHNFPACK